MLQFQEKQPKNTHQSNALLKISNLTTDKSVLQNTESKKKLKIFKYKEEKSFEQKINGVIEASINNRLGNPW